MSVTAPVVTSAPSQKQLLQAEYCSLGYETPLRRLTSDTLHTIIAQTKIVRGETNDPTALLDAGTLDYIRMTVINDAKERKEQRRRAREATRERNHAHPVVDDDGNTPAPPKRATPPQMRRVHFASDANDSDDEAIPLKRLRRCSQSEGGATTPILLVDEEDGVVAVPPSDPHESCTDAQPSVHSESSSEEELETEDCVTLEEDSAALDALKEQHSAALDALNEQHSATLDALKEQHLAALDELNTEHLAALAEERKRTAKAEELLDKFLPVLRAIKGIAGLVPSFD